MYSASLCFWLDRSNVISLVCDMSLRLDFAMVDNSLGYGGRLLSISGPTVVPVTDVSSLVTGSPAALFCSWEAGFDCDIDRR